MQTAAAYVWSFTGAPLRIALDLHTVALIREAMERHSGMEIGGLLLGSSAHGVTTITGFEPVDCEHRRGPAYDLSPEDRARFSKVYAHWWKKRSRGTTVVGYFRSHHRLGLYLDEHDFRTVQEFFPNADQVVLLVRPEPQGPPTAGFFFWDEGEMHRRESFQTFPFDAEALNTGHFPIEDAAPALAGFNQPRVTEHRPVQVPVAAAVPPRAHSPLVIPPVNLPPGRWWKSAAIAIGIPLGVLVAYFAQDHSRKQADGVAAPPPAAVAQQRTPEPVEAQPQTALPEPGRNDAAENSTPAPGESSTEKPSPWDTSGARRSMIANDRGPRDPLGLEYQGTRKVYRPPVPYGRPAPVYPDGSRTYAQQRPPQVITPAAPNSYSPNTAQPQTIQPVPPPVQQPAANAQAPQPASPVPAQTQLPRREETAAVVDNRVPEQPPVHTRRVFRPEQRPAISLEPQGDDPGLVHSVSHRFGRLVTLGMVGKDNFTPPRPVREFSPAVPDRIAHSLREPVPISVRILIDRDGHVRGTQLLTREADPELAGLALDAARKWEFEAARRNDAAVQSSVVAHFRFRPPM